MVRIAAVQTPLVNLTTHELKTYIRLPQTKPKQCYPKKIRGARVSSQIGLLLVGKQVELVLGDVVQTQALQFQFLLGMQSTG